MANEITVTAGLSVENGELNKPMSNLIKLFTQTTARLLDETWDIEHTGESTITWGDITPGWVLLQNTDTSNFVNFGTTTGNLDLRLPPKGVALFYLNSSENIIMQADTATCKVQVRAVNQ